MKANKQVIIDNLRGFIAQRSGIDARNYISHWQDTAGRAALRADQRTITKHGKHARELLRHVELSGITAQELVDESKGKRLEISEDGSVTYIAGQYFATEYRAGVCAVLASALWNYYRDDFAALKRKDESDGDAIRRKFKTMFGRSIANAWFN